MRPAQVIQRRGLSVGGKLAVVTVSLMALVSVGVYFALSQSLERTLLAAKGESAQAVGSLFAANVSAAVDFDDADGIKEAFKHLATNEGVIYAAISSDVAARAAPKGEYLRPGYKSRAKVVRASHPQQSWGAESLALSVPVWGEGKRVIAHALIEFSLKDEREKIAALKRRVLFTSLLVAGALVALLLIASRRTVVLPLKRLQASARRIEQGESSSFDIRSDDEVGDLASALEQMATAIREREAEIGQRNRDMRLVLDNVNQGFLTLSKDGVIASEYSRVVEVWFGKPPPGSHFSSYIALSDAKFAGRFRRAFEQLMEGVLPWEVSLAQFPSRLSANDKVWNVEYRLIGGSESSLDGLVVVISDITVLLETEHAERAQREVISASTRIARDPQGFTEFLTEARALVASLTTAENARTDDAAATRSLHTLKGISSTMDVHSVAELCHQLEEQMLESGHGIAASEQKRLRAVWSDYADRIEPLFTALDGRGIFIEGPRYEAFLAALEAGRPRADLLEEAQGWSFDTTQKPLERLAQSARDIARRLHKGELSVAVESSSLQLPRGACGNLWTSLVHVVRNAVDHGLEPPNERQQLGKPPAGSLTFSTMLEGDSFVLGISDDGRGVDWEAIKRRAAARGLPHETPDELERALLAPGVTTRDGATETSGRGIGTAALLDAVGRLGGRVEVRSKAGAGTIVRVILPNARIQASSLRGL
jgi:HPt (histidine-containing phosphotransfer) domain-containing protein/HAMP domain-containing protein